MNANRLTSLRLTATLAAALVAEAALACTCPSGLLQDQYDSAERIYIAQASECVDGEVTEQGHCSTSQWRLAVIEGLKGDTAIPVITKEVPVCGFQLQASKSYLLFLTEDNSYSMCNGSAPLEGYQQSYLNRRIQQLREYRDGTLSTLRPQWHFSGAHSVCTLAHLNQPASLRFRYSKRTSSEQIQDPQGMVEEVTVKPAPSDNAGDGTPKVSLNITLANQQNIVAGSVFLEAGGQSWAFERREIQFKLKNMPVPVSTHQDVLNGNAALDALTTLAEQKQYSVRAQRKPAQATTVVHGGVMHSSSASAGDIQAIGALSATPPANIAAAVPLGTGPMVTQSGVPVAPATSVAISQPEGVNQVTVVSDPATVLVPPTGVPTGATALYGFSPAPPVQHRNEPQAIEVKAYTDGLAEAAAQFLDCMEGNDG